MGEAFRCAHSSAPGGLRLGRPHLEGRLASSSARSEQVDAWRGCTPIWRRDRVRISLRMRPYKCNKKSGKSAELPAIIIIAIPPAGLCPKKGVWNSPALINAGVLSA